MIEEPVEEPVVEEPVEEPVIEEPVEEPVIEEPVEEPVVEEPVEEPVVEEPVEEPVMDEPIEEPVVEEPIEEPAVEEPIEEPVVEEPIEEPVEEPVAEEPVEEPVAEEPAEEPVAEEPIEEPIEEPVVEEPAEEPVIEEPTEDVDDAETSTEETSSVTADAVPASPEGKPFGDPTEEPVVEEPTDDAEPSTEETSSVTADAVPASPEGKPFGEPAAEEPVEEPAAEEPAEEPVVEEPVEDVEDAEPFTEETSSVTADAVPASPEGKPFGEPAEEPVVEEPAEEPVVEDPTDAPAIEEPVEEPVAEESAEEPIETPDEAEILLAEPAEAEPVEEIETEVAFDQTEVVSGVAVTVQAEPGAFPANAALSVKHVPVYKQRQADAAIEDVRDEEANVVVSYTFDIKVIDPETGAELQPAEGCEVAVSFALAEAADQNLDTNVYHLTGSGSDMTAEKLDAEVDPDAETVTATTDGFSLYTVEFTYNTLEYVMPGDTAVALSEILNAVGLTGEAEAVAVSNADLFSASNGTGEWIVTAHQAFSTTEWMKVTINGVVYEITVTDDASYTATFSCNGKSYSAGSITGTKEIPLPTILTPLEITGDVTAASVSEGQGMTVTTTAITLTKAFGTGWLRVTAGGTEYEITITSTPDSISVVLYGTLFFDKNGGSGIMDGQSVQEYSTTVLPACTFTPPDGYEFDQWEINGARYDAGATFTFGQTTTAKAIWKLREGVHSITADYNNSYGDVVVSPTMAAAGEQVTVTVQPVAGKAVDIISYSYGSTSGQALSGVEGGVYTFSMPGENTKVSVTFKEATKEPIAYVDENGSSHSCNDYSYVRSTDTSWTSWVVASQNLTLDRRVTVSGTVNLILMDGKTLTVTGGIQVGEGSTLNIYAQSGNTGELIAGNKQNSYAAGIGGNKGSYNAGTITVNGGQITATGGYSSAGIGGASEYYPYLGSAGNITIRGNADVVATGGEYSSGIGCGSGGIGGSITIDGNARVQARALEGYSGSGAAIGSGRGGYVNSITISGGTVIATGANMGSAIGNGNSNSGEDGGTISITGGDVTATATGSWGAGIGGLCKSITIGGNAVVHATGGNRGAGIGGYYQKAVGNITVEGNANVTATGGANGAGIGTGSEAEGEAVITITGGTVNASMSASNGAAAIGSGYKSKGKTTVSISGGQVTASGSSIYGVGIGGGNTGAAGEEVVVNITGGAVDASGRAGIGTANASNAKLTINISGGKVTARGAIDGSNKCAAIGQGNNSNSVTEINITGGIVRALGTGTGIGSGANSKQTPTIKLDYTDETKNGMEITAIDYNGTVTLNKSFKYQDGTGAVSTPITANKTIVPSDSTAHTHGFTYTVDGKKTITATCTNSDNQCNLTEHKATLTIGEPDGKTSMVYDGTAKAAVLTGDTDVLTADVVYKKGNTVLPSAPSDAGNYTASITLGEATATVSYEITKKSVTFGNITAKDKVYDGTTKASCTIGTGLNGAVSGDNVYAYVYTGNATFEDANVGVNKTVTFSNWRIEGTDKGNYELIQPEPQYRAITPRIITVTAKDQTVAVGGTVVSTPDQVEITSGTLVSGHSISAVTLTGDTSAITDSGTVTSSAIKILDSSNVDVTANYLVNYVAGKLTVTEAPAHTHSFIYTGSGTTITADCSAANCPLTDHKATLTINAPTSLTYDSTTKAATVTGAIPGVTTPEITYTKKGDASFTGTPKDAGTYTASITVGGITASVEYTIAKAGISPTLSIPGKTYDGNEVTYTIENNPGDGRVTSFSWEKENSDNSWSSVSDTPKDAGKYRGIAVIGETDNYQGANTTTAEFTISKAPLTVTAKANTITYGDAPANDGVEYSGFVNNETQSVLSGTLAYEYNYEQFGDVGNSYSITPKGLTSDNYEISFVAGTLTVDQKEVGLMWSHTPLTYTGKPQAPAATATGTVNNDQITVTVSGGQTNAGTGYTATASALTGDKAGNYKLPSVNSTTFAIGKASLTVTAKAKTITYGDEPTNDGVTYSGFVNGETENTTGVLSGALSYAYNYAQYGNVGSYAIMPSGLTSGNYIITFERGVLTVDQKEVGLTWDNDPLTFNGSAQAPTAAATGTVNGDTVSVTVSGGQIDAGTGYTATASGLTGEKAGNYKLPDAKTTTFSIVKASHDDESVNGSAKYGTSGEVDLSALIVEGGNLGTPSATDGDSILNGAPSATNGKLGFAFANDDAKIGKTATVTVPVASANYADYSIVVTLTVLDKDVPTLTANAVTKTYDGSAATNAQIGGTAKVGETDVAGTWTFKAGQSLTNVADSGAKTVVFTPTDTANYKSAETTLMLTVNPKSITGAAVTLSASRITYDGTQKSVTVSGVALDGVTLTAGVDYDVSGALSGTNANTYTVTVTGKGNYKDSTTATWTIKKAGATATAPNAVTGLIYNGAAQSLVSAGSATGGTIQYSLSANGPFAAAIPTGTNAGNYTVYYKTVGDSNHTGSAVGGPVNVTIGGKTVGLTWANTSFTYDGNSHAPAATATGLVGSDACTVTVSGDQKNAGSYTATATALSNANYALPQNTTQSFTINPATVTVTAQAKSKTYGEADPALTYTASGLVGSDKLTGALTRAAGNDVGTYVIQQGTLAASGNYALTYVGANLTINKKALTVTAEAKSKTYGDKDPALTYKAEGLVGSDKLTGALARDKGENAGSYAITQGTLAATGNYSLTFTGAKLAINRKAITVTADAVSKTYGDKDPELTYKASGLVGSDKLTGVLARDKGEDVGSYAITQGTLAATGNYSLTFTGANLTIDKKALTVTAEAKSKTYGDADPALTYAAEGLVGNDKLTGALARDKGEDAGSYAITQGTLAATDNYDLKFTGAKLTIKRAAVTVTAKKASKTYGKKDPAFTAKVTGLKNGDAASVIKYSLSRAKGENAGTYAITPTGDAAQGNYDVTFKAAKLTVTAKTVKKPTITVNSTAYTYDGKAKKPAVTVKDGKTVIPASEYSISYSSNVRPGTGKVKITDNKGGNYTVSGNATFTIEYGVFKAKAQASGKDTLIYNWSKVPGAQGYDLMFARCNTDGDTHPLKLLKTLNGADKLSYTRTGLDKGISYKAKVLAWKKVNGKKVYLSKSPVIHAYTGGKSGSHTNVKSLKLAKSSVTLKLGGKSVIKGTIKKLYSKLKLNTHVNKLRYFSTDISVATVSSKGTIKARAKGTCSILVVTPDGITKTVKVKVK